MVFANLSYEDKEAFFSLLDEYFQSRPHLLSSGQDALASAAGSSVSSIHKSMAANPQATASIMNAGLRHVGRPSPGSPSNVAVSNPPDEPTEANSRFGKLVSGAASNFSKTASSFGGSRAPPPVAPRRFPLTNNTGPESSSSSPPPAPAPPAPPPPPAAPPMNRGSNPVSGLVTTKRFGDINTSSKGAAFASLLPGNKNQPTAKIHIAAPQQPKHSFAPPPMRKMTTDSPSVAATPEPAQAEETHGEWAVVLYDYSSEDPGDLKLSTNENVLITERSSEDWWTGEIEGRSGLFPASYVKLL